MTNNLIIGFEGWVSVTYLFSLSTSLSVTFFSFFKKRKLTAVMVQKEYPKNFYLVLKNCTMVHQYISKMSFEIHRRSHDFLFCWFVPHRKVAFFDPLCSDHGSEFQWQRWWEWGGEDRHGTEGVCVGGVEMVRCCNRRYRLPTGLILTGVWRNTIEYKVILCWGSPVPLGKHTGTK
jgi:hypothetical protein